MLVRVDDAVFVEKFNRVLSDEYFQNLAWYGSETDRPVVSSFHVRSTPLLKFGVTNACFQSKGI